MMLSQGQQQACAYQQCGDSAPQVAAGGRALSSGGGGFMEGPASTTTSNTALMVLCDRLEKEIALLRQPQLKQAVSQALSDMMQGKLQGFKVLQGEPCTPDTALSRKIARHKARRARAPQRAP
eukprot:4440221-Prymnesium_polylepis.1